MADDIESQLRHMYMELTTNDYSDVIIDAIHEIERLRAELDAERRLGDRLADALRSTKSDKKVWSDRLADIALAAYKEARRG